jgi:hypothetical protein
MIYIYIYNIKNILFFKLGILPMNYLIILGKYYLRVVPMSRRNSF